MFGFLEYFFNFSIFVLRTKSNRRLLKTMAIFLNFVVKTALIWLVLGGFFCFFSQSETICNLHSCYRGTALLSQPIRIESFFMYIIRNIKHITFEIKNPNLDNKALCTYYLSMDSCSVSIGWRVFWVLLKNWCEVSKRRSPIPVRRKVITKIKTLRETISSVHVQEITCCCILKYSLTVFPLHGSKLIFWITNPSG